MKNMKMPEFSAEASLSKRRRCYSMKADDSRNESSAVIPQLSCWRECYDISFTNHELAGCYRVCSQLKRIFLWASV